MRMAIIREADRDPVAAVAKRHGIRSRRSTPGASSSVVCRRAMSSACGSSKRRLGG
jgi:hypothetical protein